VYSCVHTTADAKNLCNQKVIDIFWCNAFFAHPCAAALGKFHNLQACEHTPTIPLDPNLLALAVDEKAAEDWRI
jgi:hypothetical protein